MIGERGAGGLKRETFVPSASGEGRRFERALLTSVVPLEAKAEPLEKL